MPSFLSLYDILKVPPNASGEEIKSSFRRLAKIYHPDKNKSLPESEIQFITIHNAYKVLIDLNKRAGYDNYIKTSKNINMYEKCSSQSKSILANKTDQQSYSVEQIFNHINYIIWDIEIFLNKEYKTYFGQKIEGVSIQQYILKILIFIDAWVLYPAGYRDYFMEARKMESLKISDYINLIESKNSRMGHKPFYSVVNYFYDIRKRIDKLLNNAVLTDLYSYVPGLNVRLIDCIIETQNYSIYYMSNLNLALSGKVNTIEPYRHSNSCFDNL